MEIKKSNIFSKRESEKNKKSEMRTTLTKTTTVEFSTSSRSAQMTLFNSARHSLKNLNIAEKVKLWIKAYTVKWKF